MLKKILSFFTITVLCLGMAGCGSEGNTSKENNTGTTSENYAEEKEGTENGVTDSVQNESEKKSSVPEKSGKILVAYFTRNGNTDNGFPEGVDAVASASIQTDGGKMAGNAERIAGWIAEKTGGTIHAITTEEKYPSDYDKTVEQAKEEQSKGTHPDLVSEVEDFDSFQTLVLVFPNWWADLPMPVYSFFEEYDFAGKNIVVFCTHGGSGFSDTIRTIQELEPDAAVTEGLAIYHNDVAEAEDEVVEKLGELGIGK